MVGGAFEADVQAEGLGVADEVVLDGPMVAAAAADQAHLRELVLPEAGAVIVGGMLQNEAAHGQVAEAAHHRGDDALPQGQFDLGILGLGEVGGQVHQDGAALVHGPPRAGQTLDLAVGVAFVQDHAVDDHLAQALGFTALQWRGVGIEALAHELGDVGAEKSRRSRLGLPGAGEQLAATDRRLMTDRRGVGDGLARDVAPGRHHPFTVDAGMHHHGVAGLGPLRARRDALEGFRLRAGSAVTGFRMLLGDVPGAGNGESGMVGRLTVRGVNQGRWIQAAAGTTCVVRPGPAQDTCKDAPPAPCM